VFIAPLFLHPTSMKKILFNLFLLTLLSACTTNTSTKNFQHIKNYIFYSGFLTGNMQIRTINKKEYICYGDLKTRKKITIHSLDDSEKYSIDVSKINKQGEQAITYAVNNFDSIYLLSKFSNFIFLIDSSGAIKNKYNINKNLLINAQFELSPTSSPFLYNDSTFILSLNFKPDNSYQFNSLSDHIKYAKDAKRSYQLCKITNLNEDTLDFQFGTKNLYANFTKETDLTVEGNHYSLVNNRIIFTSAYSDSLYLIDPITLDVKKKIKITSDYSQVYISPISIADNLNDYKLLNQNFKSNGQIRDIVYDESKKLYYCAVNHKPKSIETSWSDPIPWSIIVLNDDFKKVDEVKMDETKYSFSIMMCSQGLLVSNYYETKDDPYFFTKNTLALFRYE
jgi:hypothetical protein